MASTPALTASDPEQHAKDLCRQMRTIRRELGDDVEELVVQAERLMDWRYHMQRYPWAMMGAAALVGYFLVPRRTVSLPTDDSTLAKLAERIPVHLPPPPEKKKQSLVGSLVSAGANMAWRAALAYATQQVSKMVAQQAAAAQQQQPAEVHHG
jgi:hypothetical protein